MNRTTIERKANLLLRDSGNLGSLPVPVEDIASHCGIEIVTADLGSKVSGVLIQRNGESIIAVSSDQSEVRRRFTLAHELGHFLLHGSEDNVFVDKAFSVKFRDQRSTTGRDLLEREANSFAAALLMPANSLNERVRRHSFDAGEDDSLIELAKEFLVSSQAMMYRLINLRLLPPSFELQ